MAEHSAAAVQAPTEVELDNDMVLSALRSCIRRITKGESDQGHTRLTVEFQDGEVRRAFVERTLGGTELVTA